MPIDCVFLRDLWSGRLLLDTPNSTFGSIRVDVVLQVWGPVDPSTPQDDLMVCTFRRTINDLVSDVDLSCIAMDAAYQDIFGEAPTSIREMEERLISREAPAVVRSGA